MWNELILLTLDVHVNVSGLWFVSYAESEDPLMLKLGSSIFC